jgi:ankyrin repeat protein
VAAVLYLLAHPLAAVDQRSADGTTPLHLCCYGGHATLAETLLQVLG